MSVWSSSSLHLTRVWSRKWSPVHKIFRQSLTWASHAIDLYWRKLHRGFHQNYLRTGLQLSSEVPKTRVYLCWLCPLVTTEILIGGNCSVGSLLTAHLELLLDESRIYVKNQFMRRNKSALSRRRRDSSMPVPNARFVCQSPAEHAETAKFSKSWSNGKNLVWADTSASERTNHYNLVENMAEAL